MHSYSNHLAQYRSVFAFLVGIVLSLPLTLVRAEDLAQYPLFAAGGNVAAPPLTMLIMGKDHTLYYEAYNDASDLSGDGILDVGYKPDMKDKDGKAIDYFGYFDSHLCYDYSSDLFTPVSKTTTKKCSGQWSGDFLNYITTTRIDALRKVLYGGKRSTDTTALTVLERSYIPQDAHSWGKEYLSEAHDHYKISDYTPLPQPAAGTRHLFANTTLANESSKKPLMRVLTDSTFRIWEWVAIERPVAGTNCISGSCETTATTQRGAHPANATAFQTLITKWGTETQKCGSSPISSGKIDTSGSNNNPFTPNPDPLNCGADDYYLTVIQGQINIPSDGDYQFATNGDDAVEVLLDGQVVTGWYNGHGTCGSTDPKTCADNTGSVVTKTLTAGWHNIEFHHEEINSGDSWQLLWKPVDGVWAVVPTSNLRKSAAESSVALTITTYKMERAVPASKMTDYTVRVQVCKDEYLDSNCNPYTDTDPNPDVVTYKPDGLLQEYGKDNQMLFGLISGSFTHPYNMKGGILRKNIESFMNEMDPILGEVDPATGVFTDMLGIVKTLDLFRIVDFKSGTDYSYNGGWLTTSPMVSSGSKFPDWGNPIAEMMYESLRYFSGKTTATSVFMPALKDGKEQVSLSDPAKSAMDLPAPVWVDPYKANSSLYCSPGAQLVISDVNPSFDTDQVPGSVFASFSGDMSGLNVATEANAIWAAENSGSGLHFIGEVNGSTSFVGVPTAKTVTGLGNIRGLSPSEPTKQGGYYSAGIARFAFKNDLRADLADKQDINTFSVALASPLPKIIIPVGTKKVTLVPFAKSVGGSGIDPAQVKFQPTNSIVDFFIEEFANTDPGGSDKNANINSGRPSIKFRINYEDVEQGADHDMDAIVVYEVKVNADNTLTINLNSEYAAGSIMQHMGYVISGTTQDGVYLEVRDKDTSVGEDPDYFLDTPAGVSSGGCAVASPPSDCGISETDTPLPLTATRTFTASSATDVATVLENPLWYAAKYGSEGNDKLAKGEASPNYFLVTNAGKLQDQLEEAFTRILSLSKETAATAAASSTRIDGETMVYEVAFDPSDWSGEVKALKLGDGDHVKLEWDAADAMPAWADRKIYTWNGTSDPAGMLFDWDDLNTAQKDYLSDVDIFNWLRGDQSKESKDEGLTGFRIRTTLLGDIVHSDPLYVGKPQNVGYKYLPAAATEKETYTSFLSVNKERTPMIYVGANDGMLHGFDATDGAEKFAYVPNALFGKLKSLTSLDYKTFTDHRDFVDGSPNVGDAFVDGAWRSILIGTLGAGGKAVFALDVTNPDAFSAEKVLWEFNDSKLGYMVGQMTSSPVIGRLQSGQWAAVFGNGYDSGTGAWLYVVNLKDGTVIEKIQASTEASNGLSAPYLIFDAQKTIVGAYAGDLQGNLWRFDLTSTRRAVKVFQAEYVNAKGETTLQPITGPVEVGTHPLGGYLIYFGTGQYMRTGDVHSRTVQSVYGIWDNSKLKKGLAGQTVWVDGTAVTDKTALLKQTIDFESTLKTDPKKKTWRIFSQNIMDWEKKSGWFIDLISPINKEEGERVAARPQILSGGGRVAFTSWVPIESTDPCIVGGGNSWYFEVDLFTGGASTNATFNINDDKKFNDADRVIVRDGVVYNLRITDDSKIMLVSKDGSESEYVKKDGDKKLSVSGQKIGEIVDMPRTLIGDNNNYKHYIPGGEGSGSGFETIKDTFNDSNNQGRMSWRQLR